MSVRELTLHTVADDFKPRLEADTDWFSDIPVFDFKTNELEKQVDRALGVLTRKAGKIGICVVVMPMRMRPFAQNAGPNIPLRLEQRFQILENTILNHGTNGTKKHCKGTITRIKRVIHTFVGGGVSGCWTMSDPFASQLQDPTADQAWEISFTGLDAVDQNVQWVNMPTISELDGTVTITERTPESTIYYTLDGSYPSKSKTLYTAPFIPEGEVLIRAVAYKDGMIASSVSAHRMSIIGVAGGEALEVGSEQTIGVS